MAPVPSSISQRLKLKYPRPAVDPGWLQACFDWVLEEHQLEAWQIDEAFGLVDSQFLSSDLADSAIAGTGLPERTADLKNGVIANKSSGGPILCQITAITDIGHSAFSLRNVRQTRIDKADMAGLAVEAEGVENGGAVPDDGEDYTIPRYPRAILRMVLSDGSRTLQAMEYRHIAGLQLGVTPLGCKVLLRDVMVRRGVAFLEPANITIFEGSRVEELDQMQDVLFNRGLRVRMGLPEIDPAEEEEQARAQEAAAVPPPVPVHPPPAPVPIAQPQPRVPQFPPPPSAAPRQRSQAPSEPSVPRSQVPAPQAPGPASTDAQARARRVETIERILGAGSNAKKDGAPSHTVSSSSSTSAYFSSEPSRPSSKKSAQQAIISKVHLELVHVGRPRVLDPLPSPPPPLDPEDDVPMEGNKDDSFDAEFGLGAGDEFELDEEVLRQIEVLEEQSVSKNTSKAARMSASMQQRSSQPRSAVNVPSSVPFRRDPLTTFGDTNISTPSGSFNRNSGSSGAPPQNTDVIDLVNSSDESEVKNDEDTDEEMMMPFPPPSQRRLASRDGSAASGYSRSGSGVITLSRTNGGIRSSQHFDSDVIDLSD